MKHSYILSIDQGTTSCRAIIFDVSGKIMGLSQHEFGQYFPSQGWVEHDACEILDTQIKCVKEAIKISGINCEHIACVGITNQRETTVVWERDSGKPIAPAIVWQCRRTAEAANELKVELSQLFKEKTGLIPDAYFSGPKIKWILDNIPDARVRAKNGELCFGTIDSWLIYKLTAEQNHLTDPSNASRTMLFNINTLEWDIELLKLMDVPLTMLPHAVPSNSNFGFTAKALLGFSAPILAVLGDQQAALFGQSCLSAGTAKCTYGTGSFLLANTGTKPQYAEGLLTTIAWQLEGALPIYALEGSSFIAGSAIQWLRDKLQIISCSEETEDLALSLDSNEGVYFVPAFVGLGSPWWNPDVRGTIAGLTRNSSRAHIARAALESIAYQIKDIAETAKNAGLKILELRVDGGVTKNCFLLQFQSDLLRIPIKRATHIEATAWGVAALAAITQGLFTIDDFENSWSCGLTIEPSKSDALITEAYRGWLAALKGTFAIAEKQYNPG